MGALKRRQPAAYSSAVWAPVSSGPMVPGRVADDGGGGHGLVAAAQQIRDGPVAQLRGDVPAGEVDDGQRAQPDAGRVGGEAAPPGDRERPLAGVDGGADVERRDGLADLLRHRAVAGQGVHQAVDATVGAHPDQRELALAHDPLAEDDGRRQLRLDGHDLRPTVMTASLKVTSGDEAPALPPTHPAP